MLGQMLPAEIFAFILVFSRIGSAVMLLPGIGENYVFSRIRLSLALALTLIMYPLVRDSLPVMPISAVALFVLIIGEVIIGLFIGGISRLLISSLHVGGVVIAFQSSLAFAQTVDPNQGTQGAVLAALMTISGVVLIFVSGLHMLLFAGIRDSYELFPAGQPPPVSDFAQTAVELVSSSFKVGVQMAAPFIVYGLVFYIGLGVLQRLVPQVQLFFIAMPAQMLMAFLMITLVLSSSLIVFLNYFEANVVRLLAGP
ncbi:MAG: flagellar type III secretion system protein FliR [Rhodospirillaceae bacterium]|jgi:flagellar biosynthesis protein FliR|nr:flagellar type III secretion system protein FliR [Rhodospirillaceae bacterium]MBT4565066.1 flagellar type III secretion system protein FliR [Rhodospirillaceae bacterium]MBT4743008.1 flagellar type III secretion system protein FliR [Rhodospirillaceae bacterium]MBT5126759.1 flagellar type III secretion system protein FliR [Rhodospirillaceae bacterium]MBT6259415.1 flagellar type III secretion system protein FliR [Rhodospirillaceae bacterium]